jgi:hypothetical protein
MTIFLLAALGLGLLLSTLAKNAATGATLRLLLHDARHDTLRIRHPISDAAVLSAADVSQPAARRDRGRAPRLFKGCRVRRAVADLLAMAAFALVVLSVSILWFRKSLE